MSIPLPCNCFTLVATRPWDLNLKAFIICRRTTSVQHVYMLSKYFNMMMYRTTVFSLKFLRASSSLWAASLSLPHNSVERGEEGRPSPLRELQRNNEVVISWSRGHPWRCSGYFSYLTNTVLSAADVSTRCNTWQAGTRTSLPWVSNWIPSLAWRAYKVYGSWEVWCELTKSPPHLSERLKTAFFASRAKFSTDC